jgi:hypothetical protein
VNEHTSWAARNPRAAGVLAILVGAVLASTNLVMIEQEGRGISALFPFSGLIIATGVLSLMAGVSAGSYYAAPGWYRVATWVAAGLGGGAGLAANWVLFGTLA